MHNIHICRVLAPNQDEASDIVETHLYHWGNENNWYNIEGCLNVKTGVFHHMTNYEVTFMKQFNTVDDVRQMLIDYVADSLEKGKTALDNCLNGVISSHYDWYTASDYCKLMASVSQWSSSCVEGFNIEDDVFNAFSFDEVGITELINDDDTGDMYLVFVNMHS